VVIFVMPDFVSPGPSEIPHQGSIAINGEAKKSL
jgi:hypothetical protein